MLIPREYQQECADKAIGHMRKTDEPGVLVVTTAGGKSVITTIIAKVVAKAGKRVLCLAPNGDLVSESAKKYRATGEYCSIFSASLNSKATGHQVVFGTPLSVVNSLNEFNDEYALLLIDECATVSDDDATTHQQIISHLKSKNPKLRILGLDAVPVRGKEKLIGDDNTFKHVIHELPHHVLSKLGWVVEYRLGYTKQHYNLANIKLQGGHFKQSEIDDATLNKERLSRSIINEMIQTMNEDDRQCAIIFASSIRHAEEVLSYLPLGEAALVTGKTPKPLRKKTIEEARQLKWKYLITVNALSVGTDIPCIDTVVFLRATESVRLLLQGMGRGCRLFDNQWSLPPGEMNWLHPSFNGRKDCLVLDHGENLERFSLDDDLTLTGLIEQKSKQDDGEYFAIDCPECHAENKHTSHRCVGILPDNTRCSYRFVSKECNHCQTPNSPSARYCWKCDGEILDPNKKLSRNPAIGAGTPFHVAVMEMTLKEHWKGESQSLRIEYKVTDGDKTWLISEFMKNFGFHKFMSQCGGIANTIELAVKGARGLNVPSRLMVKKNKGSKYFSVVARYFDVDSQNQLDEKEQESDTLVTN